MPANPADLNLKVILHTESHTHRFNKNAKVNN